jgi:hypothetical protein
MNYKFIDNITNWTDKFDEKKINNEEKLYDKSFNNHYIPNKNVLMALVGPSGSGKTSTIIEYLKRTVYKGYLPFYQVIYFTASTSDEPLLNNLKKILGDGITLIDNVDNLPTIEDFKDEKEKTKKRLIVFDDINNLPKKKLESLNSFFNSGRKFFSHIICMAQNYTALPVQIRRNCNLYLLYKSNDNTTINYMLKNHNMYNLNKEKLRKLYDICTKEKGSFLKIDLTADSIAPITHNFTDIIPIETLK